MSSASNTPPEGSPFDETTAHSNKRRREDGDDEANNNAAAASGENGAPPKSKRIACIICRKRKLKCDGTKPSCSTCTRLGHSCAYDEVRKKSGPKRGYVKALEERLKQVETLLKTQDPIVDKEQEQSSTSFVITNDGQPSGMMQNVGLDMNGSNPNIGFTAENGPDRWAMPNESPQIPQIDDMAFNTSLNMGMTAEETTFTWEMIGLGLDEPLPPQDTVDDLHKTYFDKIHPSIPMIHKGRYLAAMNLAPTQRPPVCLRYAMWTLACSVTDKYSAFKEIFYQRARRYVELDYLKGHGEHMISVAHAQTHILLASYEFKMMFFPRAWMSTGSAVRMSQMMGLHRLDGAGLDVKQCLPGPRDWTEREERRRTFWMAFCEDRYASIGTGWPMTIDEKDILTNLPASEEAFEKSKPERTQTLSEALQTTGASTLSSYAGVVLMACLFGRNLVHLHRPDSDDKDNDLDGEFWKRHRNMDHILLNTSLNLPDHLKLPCGLSSPNIVFTNMNIHTSTICLHQAAIYKADKNRLPASVSKESKVRCITAANEIASIMRMISHLDLSGMNPFISFCLYVAARVFVQYLKSRPEDSTTADSLRFLLTAMSAMKSKNPLTESFLVQLDVDLESLGARNAKYQYFSRLTKLGHGPAPPVFNSQVEGGRVDHCNFLKIVDDSPPVTTSPNMNQPQQTSFNDQNQGLGSSNTPDVFNNDFSTDLSWMASLSSTQNSGSLHPGGLQGFQADQANSLRTHQSSYGRSDSASASNGMDMDFSDQGQSSDRPTPASSNTPSDIRSTLAHPNQPQPHHQNQNAQQQPRSSRSSFEDSPGSAAANSQAQNQQPHQRGFLAADNVDFNSVTTGLTPAGNGVFAMPDTPGKDAFAVPTWADMNAQGLTPVGEGVFQALMGMGPLEMEMGWDGQSG